MKIVLIGIISAMFGFFFGMCVFGVINAAGRADRTEEYMEEIKNAENKK